MRSDKIIKQKVFLGISLEKRHRGIVFAFGILIKVSTEKKNKNIPMTTR